MPPHEIQSPDSRTSSRVRAVGRNLGGALDLRRNSLNFLRLILAVTVLASHAITIGRFGNEDFLHHSTLGTVAVYGFFGISGFLIARSAERNGTGRYLWQRFLRIFPAFWVCLLVTAFGFGLVGWLSQSHHSYSTYLHPLSGDGPLTFVWRNIYLKMNQVQIAGTAWNGSLWTLFYEFICYLLLGAMALFGMLRHRVWTFAALIGLWGLDIGITFTPASDHFNVYHNWVQMNLLKFAVVFLMGAVIYLYRESVPDSGLLALGCTAVFTASMWLPGTQPYFTFTASDLLMPLIAYPLLWLGAHLPLQRVGAENDYSYGIYVYAYPVTVLLVIWHANSLPYPLFTLAAVALTVPFAVISWHAIERRALALKRIEPPWRRTSRAESRPVARGPEKVRRLDRAVLGEQDVVSVDEGTR
jgi:peptidoglycan/LPS O-acetylase OafA/YrhL